MSWLVRCCVHAGDERFLVYEAHSARPAEVCQYGHTGSNIDFCRIPQMYIKPDLLKPHPFTCWAPASNSCVVYSDGNVESLILRPRDRIRDFPSEGIEINILKHLGTFCRPGWIYVFTICGAVLLCIVKRAWIHCGNRSSECWKVSDLHLQGLIVVTTRLILSILFNDFASKKQHTVL